MTADPERQSEDKSIVTKRLESASGLLRNAARRVEAQWRDSLGDAIDAQEVSEYLVAIVMALAGQDQGEPVERKLQSILGRRLLELFRAELVHEWKERATSTPTAADEVLDSLSDIEALREAIDPDWSQHFANRLSGPDGLALVVEVAHDLSSPLTSILFLAETLQRGQSGDVNDLQHRQLGLIYSAALGLSELSSNVIELAKGGSRLAEDEPAPFSVSVVLSSVSDMVRPMAEEKGLSMRLLPPRADHRMGHALALSRVLLNLTTNAIKFTEQGFVEITTKETSPTAIEFSVRDTGHGISDKALETLYTPFRRSSVGDGYAFSGTGLGLALCRRLVEALGSELEVETRGDWGTRFWFELELTRVETL